MWIVSGSTFDLVLGSALFLSHNALFRFIILFVVGAARLGRRRLFIVEI